MNPKYIRRELYEEDYVFNEQEYKEFHAVRIEPYWKVRGTSYSLSLNCFGDKQSLLRRINNLLFNNYLHQKPEYQQLVDLQDADIDIIVQNLRCSSGKYDNISIKDLKGMHCENDIIEEKIFNQLCPWQIVPELYKMNKRLTYSDIFKGMSNLMRPTMVFYNHLSDEEETLTAIVFLPYTPKSVEYLSPPQIYSLLENLGMRTNYEGLLNVVDVYKQKLLDLYYAVDDNPKLHGVHPCHNYQKECCNLASQYCENNMCKICCQDLQNKKPCVMHDNFEQFYRYKLKQLYTYEERKNFDRQRTLRIYCRKLIRKYDLEQVFQGFQVEWDKVALYYHYQAQRIQYVYLVFQSQETASQIYKDRHIYELKLEKFDASIQYLNNGLWKSLEHYQEPENVLALIRPLSPLDVVQDLPHGQEYVAKIHQLIQTVTQLPSGEYTVEEDTNPLTQEKEQNHLFVILPNREYVEKLYNAQPYFGCIIAHKISHIQYFPLLRPHKNMCLMCTGKKEHNCFHDMCRECCSRQKYDILRCPCSFNTVQDLQVAKEDLLTKDISITKEHFCDKCTNPKDKQCVNGLCQQCCVIQAIKLECPFHEIPTYLKELVTLQPKPLARRFLQMVGECNVKIRAELLAGRYDWFRPIHNTHLMNGMIKANKDLQDVKDNGSIIRGPNTLKTYKKEGKIFTFQANEPINVWQTPYEKSFESINKKGEPFVDYCYGEDACRTQNVEWVKNGVNKYRMYSKDEYDKYINAPQLKVRTNFHLFLIGLDKSSFTVKELYQELYMKLTGMVGQIEPNNILILDNETILTDVFSSEIFLASKNLDENLNTIGRVACVKFENILDAIALMTKEVKVLLPLYNNTNGEPVIYPSSGMIKWLSEIDVQNISFDYMNAGFAYNQKNKEAEQLQSQLNNIMKFNQPNPKQFRGGAGNQGGNFNNMNKQKFQKNRGGPRPQKKVKMQ